MCKLVPLNFRHKNPRTGKQYSSSQMIKLRTNYMTRNIILFYVMSNYKLYEDCGFHAM